MKKVDFGKCFLDFKGGSIDSATMSDELSKALFSAGSPGLPIENEDKYRAYKISTKLISQDGVIDVSDDDVSFLKKFCMLAFTAGAYGQIVELIEK